jgi:hypothetical protein
MLFCYTGVLRIPCYSPFKMIMSPRCRGHMTRWHHLAKFSFLFHEIMLRIAQYYYVCYSTCTVIEIFVTIVEFQMDNPV